MSLRSTRWAIAALFLSAQAASAQRSDTLALSLADAVALALRIGEESRLAAAQIDLADAQVGVARAAAFPQLRVTAAHTHVLENARANAVGSIFNQPNTYTSNANLTQTLFQGGRISAGSRMASNARAAARLDADEVRAQLSLDVQRAYVQVLYAERLLEIRRASVELATQRVSQIEQFERAGRAARFDVLSARVERGNLEPLVVDAASARELAILELRRLINAPANQSLRLTTSIDPTAVQIVLASVASDSAQVADRASVRAAELNLAARGDAIRVARADYLPTISVFAQSGYQAFPRSGFPSSGGRVLEVPCGADDPPGRVCTQSNGGWFPDRSIGVNIAWPLFDGLRAKNNLEAARVQERIAQIQLVNERETAATEVATARAALASAQALFAARASNAAEAREAFSLASLRFTRGAGTTLEISSSQVALLQAQTDEARSVYDLYLASVGLARALGKPLPIAGGSGRVSSPNTPDASPSQIPPR